MNKFYINSFRVLVTSLIVITIVSIAICCLLYEPLTSVTNTLNNSIPSSLSWLAKIGYCFQPLSFSAVFSLLWIVFDLLLWKAFARAGILLDLSGTWCGVLDSSYSKAGVKYCTMVVKQTFTRITITCYFSDAKDSGSNSSYSKGFYFGIKPVGDELLVYFSYKNIKQNNDSPDFNHPGFNFFYFNNNRLDGQYCTFRNKRTFGGIKLVKINNNRKYDSNIWKAKNFENI